MTAAEMMLCCGGLLVVVGSLMALIAEGAGGWRSALLVQAVGFGCLGVCGAAVTFGAAAFGSGFHVGWGPHLGMDRLSAFFMMLLALVAVPACVTARDSLSRARSAPLIAALTGLFGATLAMLLCARDLVTFLGCWELMTVIPAVVILIEHRDAGARRSVFTYLAITHLAGVGVWVSLSALLIGAGELGTGTRALIAVAAVLGFGAKAGLVPIHTWLPRVHPLAPPHVSALMSGVMVKLALYGMIRVLFQWDHPVPVWVSLLLLGLGALSAVGGIVYSVFQRELKALLAFCTIENVGIIGVGLAAALLLAHAGQPLWSQIVFAAAMLQTLCHGLAKGLMFLVCGSLSSAVGKLELGSLGGMLRTMPWTASVFIVGSVSLAGLPPLGGFAAEWITLESLIHLTAVSHAAAGVAAASAVTIAAVAIAAGLAVLAFVTATGVVVLGRPRSAPAAAARERGGSIRWTLAVLAGVLAVAGILSGFLVGPFSKLLGGRAVSGGSATLRLPDMTAFPVLAVAVCLVAVTAFFGCLARGRRAAPAPVWASGQAVVPEMTWTAAGFTKTLRLMAEPLLRPTRERRAYSVRGVLQYVTFTASVPHLFETHVYEPLAQRMIGVAARLRGLQSGSLRAYLAYLVMLILLMLVLLRAGVLT